MKTQVLVIGGGPAGSTAATLLARENVSVTVLERDRFPRHHIGESLLPSILTMLDLLGVREKFEAHGFRKKYGAYFAWGGDTWEIEFGDPNPDVPGSGYGFEVERSEFDHLLLQHSESQGAQVIQEARVTEILFDDDGRPYAAEFIHEGVTRQISFDYLVDASGRAGLLASRYLDNRSYNEGFKNVAAYGYWEGAQTSDLGPVGGVLIHAIEEGWVWGIPLQNDTLSVGVVMNHEAFKAQRSTYADLRELYLEKVAAAPTVAELLESASLVGDIRHEQDFSYSCRKTAGPGYFIAGDSAHFLDPLLSSGVHLATTSGMLAAAGIATVLHEGLDEHEAAAHYDSAYRMAYTRFLVLVSSLYRNYRGKRSLFWQAQQMTSSELGELDIKGAFRHVVSGLADVEDLSRSSAEIVLSEMSRLIDEYYPAENDKTDEWYLALPEEEQARILAEVRPLAVPTEYSLDAETALGGFYVETEPRLRLRRASPERKEARRVDVAALAGGAPGTTTT